MRICIPSISLDTAGGAERVVVSDAQRFADRGHNVTILTEGADKEIISNYGLSNTVDVYEYSINEDSLIPAALLRASTLRRCFELLNPDAIIAHYHEKSAWLAISTLQADPVFAVHVHGSLFWFEDNINRSIHLWKECVGDIITDVPGHSQFYNVQKVKCSRKIHRAGEELLESLSLRGADEVFVNTYQVADELNCLYGISARVNPPGINLDVSASNSRVNLPTENPYIFTVSRLDPRKRIDLLIRAFAELEKEQRKTELVIGGTGKERERLQSLAEEESIQERVHFVGYIEESNLQSYYSKAEIFACPGWMSYGLTPLEAVRSETKVALSADAFVKEIIGDEPGVEVLHPDIGNWVAGLESLLGENSIPSAARIPSSDEHADTKLRLIKNHR